uniref:Uncharacterized protein n=1 Tax=Euplotes harpa TaxID=151035 RepID=A0A7S3JE26_9SPIT
MIKLLSVCLLIILFVSTTYTKDTAGMSVKRYLQGDHHAPSPPPYLRSAAPSARPYFAPSHGQVKPEGHPGRRYQRMPAYAPPQMIIEPIPAPAPVPVKIQAPAPAPVPVVIPVEPTPPKWVDPSLSDPKWADEAKPIDFTPDPEIGKQDPPEKKWEEPPKPEPIPISKAPEPKEDNDFADSDGKEPIPAGAWGSGF